MTPSLRTTTNHTDLEPPVTDDSVATERARYAKAHVEEIVELALHADAGHLIVERRVTTSEGTAISLIGPFPKDDARAMAYIECQMANEDSFTEVDYRIHLLFAPE